MKSDAVFCRGFPAELESIVLDLSAVLGDPLHESRSGDNVILDQGVIEIPTRVYVEEPQAELFESLDVVQEGIARCLLARHHDGFVRQAQIADLVRLSEPWSAPYLVALLGEYVIEIHQALLDNMISSMEDDQRRQDTYRQLLTANPRWWGLIQNRVVSYWAAYHRRGYMMERSKARRRIPDSYPAALLVRNLSDLSGVEPPIKPLR